MPTQLLSYDFRKEKQNIYTNKQTKYCFDLCTHQYMIINSTYVVSESPTLFMQM